MKTRKKTFILVAAKLISLLVLFEVPAYSFLPFILFLSNTVLFYYSQNLRGNRMRDLFYEQVINFFMFPLYVEAFLTAMFGRKITFGVTPKTRNHAHNKAPSLIIQELALLACIAVLLIGFGKFAAAGSVYMILNLFWLAYSVMLLGTGLVLIKKQYGKAVQLKKNNQNLPRLFGDNDMHINGSNA